MLKILICFVYITSVVSLFLNGPCSLSAVSQFESVNAAVVNIPQNCTSGDIQWNYPMGLLHLKLTKPNSSFKFCFNIMYGLISGQVIEFTGGVNRTLNVPTSGKPACSESVNGSIDIGVKTIDEINLYMTTLNYTVLKQ